MISIKADKLLANNPGSSTQSAIYIAPSKLAAESGLGQLFIIVEARSKERKIPSVLGQLIKEISEYYYHSPTKNAGAAIETVCQYFNENIHDISGKDTKWIKDKLSVNIATIEDNQLILSYLNNISAWLFRQGKMHNITGGQKMQKKPQSKKILSHLISGELEDGDSLMLTNSTIFDYFSHEKIKQIVTTLAPTQACAFFKNTLLDYKTPISFNTIIIKTSQENQPAENPINENLIVGKKHESYTFEKKDRTNSIASRLAKSKLLTESILNATKNKIKKKQNITDIQGNNSPKNAIPITKFEENKDESDALSAPKKSNLAKHRLKITILIIAALFVASLFLVNKKQDTKENLINYENIVNKINNKINASEAALIYKDEEKAQDLLTEARNILATLPQNTDEQIYKYQELEKNIEKKINNIFHLEQISGPDVLVKVSNISNISSNIIEAKNNLYFAANGAIHKINPENQSITRVADVQGRVKKILNFDSNHILLYIREPAKIFMMNIDNNTTRLIALALPNKDSQPVDLDSYAKKIYMLDKNDGEIYKYSYNTSNFSDPVKWLNQDIDLKNNISLSIDGNIWLGSKNSQITKLFKGKKEIFKLIGAYEPISDNTTIYTNEDLDNIYLLDNNNHRSIIAAKQGKIIKQLLLDSIEEDIISITPNIAETTLYILTSDNVYNINI